MKALCVLLLFITAPCRAHDAASVQVVRVGDGAVDASFIEPYDNLWRVYLRYADGRIVERGVTSDHVRVRDDGGGKALTRIEGTSVVKAGAAGEFVPQMSMTFNVADPKTLAARLGAELSADGMRTTHRFGPGEVRTSRGNGAETTAVLSDAVFDLDGGMAGLVLAALPLKPGYAASLPTLGAGGFERIEARVVRAQAIAAGGRMFDTFVVELGAPAQATYWLSKSAPYVIRVEVANAAGVAVWEMADRPH